MGRCIIENPCFYLDSSKVNPHVKRYKAAIKSLAPHYNGAIIQPSLMKMLSLTQMLRNIMERC